jgi:hypothetical protein
MITQLRAQPAMVRAALALLAGLLTFVMVHAMNKQLDKRHRQELSAISGAAVAVIVWLLLLPQGQGAGSQVNITPPGAGNITVPPGAAVTVSPLNVSFPSIGSNYDPSVIFNNPSSNPTIQTSCGCEARRDAWAGYIAQLWSSLDAAMPNGPSGGISVAA